MRERVPTSVIDRGGAAIREYPTPRPARGYPSPLVRLARPTKRAGGDRHPAGGVRPESRDGQVPRSGQQTTGPILVVDDDRSILATVLDILEAEGYPVVAASDGHEALRRVAELRPSLVLLDMRMPGITGWEVARQLRAGGAAVPILVMTAAQDARLWAEQIGAAGYLAKPFDLDDLLAAVARLWPA